MGIEPWIDTLAPYTRDIRIDHVNKVVHLTHPHWSNDKDKYLYRKLIKEIKCNNLKDYTVQAVGFYTIEGLIILHRFTQYLNKLKNVEIATLSHKPRLGSYILQVKFI